MCVYTEVVDAKRSVAVVGADVICVSFQYVVVVVVGMCVCVRSSVDSIVTPKYRTKETNKEKHGAKKIILRI